MWRLYPQVDKVHYLKYLTQVREKDFEGAMDSLHRYYDILFCKAAEQQASGTGLCDHASKHSD